MEYGSIEREFHVEASPEVVFDVISSPEHIRHWWNAETDIDPVPGATGDLVWGDRNTTDAQVVPITVIQVDPPRLFSFRWASAHGAVATADNALLVTFQLSPSGAGTSVRMVEVGFREMGWEAAVLEEQYNDHVDGWTTFLAALGAYAGQLASAP